MTMQHSRVITYGVIGCGMMGQEHLRNIALLPGTAIGAIFEPDAAMRARARTLAGEMHSGFAALRSDCPMNLRRAYAAFAPSSAVRADLDAFAPNMIHVSAPDPTGHAAVKWARAHDLPVLASVHTRFETYPR